MSAAAMTPAMLRMACSLPQRSSSRRVSAEPRSRLDKEALVGRLDDQQRERHHGADKERCNKPHYASAKQARTRTGQKAHDCKRRL